MEAYFSMALTIALLMGRTWGLLCNGNFEQYDLVYSEAIVWTYLNSDYACWYNSIGEWVEVKIFDSLTSAVVQLSHDYPYVLCQDVQLQPTGIYQLNFSVYNSIRIPTSTIFLKIDNSTIFNFTTPTPTTFSQASVNFTANYNRTQICFDSTFTVSPYSITMAPCLDNITLVLVYLPPVNTTNTTANTTNTTNTTNKTTLTPTPAPTPTPTPSIQSTPQNTTIQYLLNEDEILGASAVLSIPFKLIVSLRCAYLLLDDIWLYDYSDKNFTGMLNSIFRTIAVIQLLKFQYLDKYIGFGQYQDKIGISDYRNYSQPRFVEVENASSIFIESNFTFLVYSLPQSILLCVALCLIFHATWQYRISKVIRKFYFLKTVLAIALLEENLSYFIFVCLLNTNQPFSFLLVDKISFCFTILFLFCLVMFTFCFFPLVLEYLGKLANYFADFTYRETAGFWYKTVSMIRNVLRAVVFCFFHNNFQDQMLAVSAVQLLIILSSTVVESTKRIFRSRTMYSCHLLYYFLFVLLNFTLYVEGQDPNLEEEDSLLLLVKQAQDVILYCLVVVAVFMMVVDLLAFSRLKIMTLEQFQKQLYGNTKNKKQRKPKKQAKIKVFSIEKDSQQRQQHLRKRLKNIFFGNSKKDSNFKLKNVDHEDKFTHKNAQVSHKGYLTENKIR